MAGYLINNYDGSPLFELPDATLSRNLDINLVGKNYAGYGEWINESLLFLLQNFSNTTPPKRPVEGQLWYDREERKLKVYIKENDIPRWMSVGTAEVSPVQPVSSSKGGMWLDTTENKFYVYDGNEYQLIGPEGIIGYDKTKFAPEIIYDEVGLPHPVIVGYVDGKILIIVADAQYRLATLYDENFPNATIIPGFSVISRGINLKDDVKFIGSLNGNADTATQLETERKINGVGFNGTKDITITAGTAAGLIPGAYLDGTEFNGIDAVTWNVQATPDNIGDKVIARNILGDFWANTANVTKVVGVHKGNVESSTNTLILDHVNKKLFATVKGDVLASDDSVIIDHIEKSIFGTLKGDVLASDNSKIIDFVDKKIFGSTFGSHRGNVLADDNTVLIDSSQKTFFSSELSIGENTSVDKNAIVVYGSGTSRKDIKFVDDVPTNGGIIRYVSGPGRLQFIALDNGVENIGINIARSTGNVSIGTIDTTYKFQVEGSGRISQSLITPNIAGSVSSSGTLTIKGTSNSTKGNVGVIFDDNISSTNTSTGSVVVTGGVGVSGRISSTEVVTTDETVDNLTVKTKVTSPDQKLFVEGSMRLSGVIYDQENSPGISGYVLSTTVNGLKWVIPQSGNEGIQGIQGIQGLQGPQGFQGFQGIKGDSGGSGIISGGEIGQIIRKKGTADGDVGWADSISVFNSADATYPPLMVSKNGLGNVAIFKNIGNDPAALTVVTDRFLILDNSGNPALEPAAGIKSTTKSLYMNLNDGATQGLVLFNFLGDKISLSPIRDSTVDLGYVGSITDDTKNRRWGNAYLSGRLEVSRKDGGSELAVFRNRANNKNSGIAIVNSTFNFNNVDYLGSGINALDDSNAVYMNLRGGVATAALVQDSTNAVYFVPAGLRTVNLGHPTSRWQNPQFNGIASFTGNAPGAELRIVSSGVPGLDNSPGLLSTSNGLYFNITDGGNLVQGAILAKPSGGSLAFATPSLAELGSSGQRWGKLWTTTQPDVGSDRNLKTEISSLELGLDLILNLKPVSYRLKSNPEKVSMGLIAQDVADVLNKDQYSAVSYNKETGTDYGLAYSEFIAPLIKAVQELNEKVKYLENKISELTG